MFKRRAEDSGRNNLFQFAFKIFFVHIINIIVFLIVAMLLVNGKSIGIVLSDEATIMIITIICLVIYLVLSYLEGWRRGERDHNLVLYGHMKEQKNRGFLAGLISQIPGLICAVILLFPSASFETARLARYFYIHCNAFLVYMDDQLAAGAISDIVWSLSYFLPAVIPVVVVGLAYRLGYKSFRVLDKLMFRKPTGDKKRDNLR